MNEQRRRRIRRRALRAAQAVTLGLAMAACGESHVVGDAGSDAVVRDGGFDAGSDAGFDASECSDPPSTRECCELVAGGFWDDVTDMCLFAVPGPFVPPRMV